LGEEKEERGNDDVVKLLALRRNFTVKPVELELMSLCKSNQLMRKALQQAKQICLSNDDAEMKIKRIAFLLEKY
jgi:hypothetical protein